MKNIYLISLLIELNIVSIKNLLSFMVKNVTLNLMTCLNSDIRKVIIFFFFKRDGVLIEDFTEGVKIFGKPYRKSPEDKYLKKY
ncbi:hypothetical protein DZN94_03045 [Streptococcus pyogenes]|nr:hypothetical protein DZN94_03045 [Streptococcus pyogenes]